MVRAAGFGAGAHWAIQPPVSRQEAASEFGAEISESAWRAICEAFDLHAKRLADLDSSRDNQNPNDLSGWYKRKRDAEKGIETALAGLGKINRDFLFEAANNVSLKRSGGRESYEELQRLDTALDEIFFLSWLMREAEPISREIVTEAESRKAMARSVFKALKGAGATLSNGWVLSQGSPSYADLTGFERLIELLKIHHGATPIATAKWLRDALAQDR
tara:strand:+ start:730 stop:1383 length:654 start_codon:yes stop_codon:yes gene_type:complete